MALPSLRIPVSYGPSRAARNPIALALALALAVLLGSAPVAADTPLRLVAIGDSLTAGYGLEQGDGFVSQLDRWLAEHGAPAVEVVNMGVSGDTTAGGRARLGWALADGADAVILALGANDVLRGIDPAESRGNLEAMLGELAGRGLPVLLLGIPAPANYGPDYKAAFDAIYPELAERHEALYDPFFLEGLVGEPGLLQEDGLHPNAAGVARIVARIGPLVLKLIARVER